VIAGVRGWHLDEVYLKIDASAAWLLILAAPRNSMGFSVRKLLGRQAKSSRKTRRVSRHFSRRP
jgi:hypothetical protein